jgi:autotransporter-associated beta strand protein
MALLALLTPLGLNGAANLSLVPGVAISYQPSPSTLDILFGNDVYIADADILVLSNGNCIASHSYFGSGSTEDTAAVTKVFRSTNKGTNWGLLATFQPLWRASLFEFRGALYIIGPEYNGGSYSTIRKSTNNGTTWTTPVDANTGLFSAVPLSGTMGTPNNPLIFNNRLYAGGGTRSTVSTPTNTVDPMVAADWRYSGSVQTFTTWQVGLAGALGSAFIGEGQAVASPDTGVVVLGKVEGLPYTAVMRAERSLGNMRFGPSNDFAAMPGAEKKFGAMFDPVTGKFYVLGNPILPIHAADASLTPQLKRNTAAVLSSRDLINWEVEKIFLYSTHLDYEAFQYLQFDFDGDDMAVASRTAFDVADANRPPRGHDSNLLTFHRIPNFRTHVRNHFLLADTANNQVLRYEVTQHANAPLGKFTLGTTFSGTPLTAPKDLAQDINGDVYVRENGGRILQFDALGNFIATNTTAPVSFTTPQLSIAQAPTGERTWTRGGGGNWAEMTNWFYWGRPDTTAEVAIFGTATGGAATITVDADPLIWSFNTASDEEGWATSGISGALATNGVFSGTTTNTTPNINLTGQSFPGSLCPEVRIRMKASGPSQPVSFLWGNTLAESFQSSRRITVNYTGAGAFQTLVIPLAGNTNWDGKIITRIRFDLPQDSGATFEVDSVELPKDSFRLKGLRFRNSSAYTISGGGSLRIEPATGNALIEAQLGSHTLGVPMTLVTNTDFDLTSGATLNVSGMISGGGSAINKTGAGTLIFSGNNTYSGATTISAGTLRLGAANVIPNGAGKGNVSIAGTLDLNGNSETINGLSGVGMVDGMSGTPTLIVGDNNQTSTFDGVIKDTAGSLSIVKMGTGTLTLSGANSYSGDTVVSNGTFNLTGSLSSAVTVQGGKFSGTGTVNNNLSINGGIHAPGSSPGVTTVKSNYVLNAGGTLQIEINGTAPGTQYDQVNLTSSSSTVTLAGTLQLVISTNPSVGASCVVITNAGAAPVVGSFVGLPPGQAFLVGSNWWRISYSGGDGNDVVLSAIDLPQLTAVPALTANQLTMLTVTGESNLSYQVQASTNLTNWITLFTTNSPVLPLNWIDTNTGSFLKRFYRILLGP